MSASNPFPNLNLNFQSPNAIPSRTSSIGHTRESSLNAQQQQSPSKAILHPVPEASWLAASSSTGSTVTPGATQAASASAAVPPLSPDAIVGVGSFPPQPAASSSTSGPHHHQHTHSRSHSHTRARSRKASVISNHATFMAQMPTAPPVPPDPLRFATDELPWGGKKTWNDDKERILTGPFDYLFAHPGKDFRAQVINAFNAWLEVPDESLDIITNAVGMLHTASLLIDDVEDSSLLRRGLPVAHSIFGTAQTINSANYVYFVSLQELQRLKNPKAISIFAEELVHLHRGQGMDLFWRDTLTCPTEDDYLEMVGNKTGGLFRMGIKLMQAESRSLIDCVPLVNIIGLIFQIRDDYMNLSSPEYSHNKGLCEDLTEGKFSFPIIHSIRSDPTNLQLLNILKQKPTEQEVKRYAVSYMEGTRSFEYTKNVVHVLIERARKLAEEIDEGRGKSGGVQRILDKMAI